MADGTGIPIPILLDSGISIKQIRDIINIPEPDELSNDTIQIAIDRATVKVYRVSNKYGEPLDSDLTIVAILNWSAYLAYLSYSDRVFQQYAGRYTQNGEWDPIAQEILRKVEDKLKALKEVADESLDDITDDVLNPVTEALQGGIIPTISKTKDSEYYPRDYHTNDMTPPYPSWDEE